MAMSEIEIGEFLSRLRDEPETHVKRVQFPDLSSQPGSAFRINLKYLDDIPVDLCAELGEKVIRVGELLELDEGGVLELNKSAGETVSLKVNGLPFARGEVVVVNDLFAVRVHVIEKPHLYEPDEVL